MKVYAFGEKDRPVLLLLPGTCCHWKGNFGHVIPALAQDYRVLAVSYDGFDETEATEFPTMREETEKIEDYLLAHCGGHIRGPTAAPWAGPSWGCWRRGAGSAWTTASWGAPIWTRRRRSLPSWRRS